MNIIDYATQSLLISVETISDKFLGKGKEIVTQIADTCIQLTESFIESVNQTKDGVINLAQGVTGIIVMPLSLGLIILGIPAIALGWTIVFFLAAIAHTASIPLAYLWCLYQKIKEAISPQVKSIDYFPEVEVDLEPEPLVVMTPPLALLAGLAAGLELEVESVSYDWSPSYLLYTVDEVHEAHVEAIDIEAFRWGLEQQFNPPTPRQSWKEYILQHLDFPRATTLLLSSTTSFSSEVGRSLSVEVQTVLEFPEKPSNKVLQRWDKDQLRLFCDRVNAVQKESITKYKGKNVSKTTLIKKIKEFYET